MDIKLQFLFVINIAELNLRRLNQIYKTTKRVREFCVITWSRLTHLNRLTTLRKRYGRTDG